MTFRVSPPWRPWLISLSLFLLNAYICRELFFAEFLSNLDSNEGAFTAFLRFYREHPGERWFPWFSAGMPIENAYQPLLPVLGALTSLLTGLNPPRALHLLMAFMYCLGPVTLFWFAWDWSRSTALSLTAAVAYSLLSPAEILIPVLRIGNEGFWGPLRLYNIVHYAEDPHNLALALLPVALLFLRRAMASRTPASIIGAVVFSAAVVATNIFGAMDLVIGGLALILCLRKGLWTLLGIGLASYLWLSPWLPPSLVDLIRHDQWGAGGQLQQSYLATLLALAVFAVLAWATRRLSSPPERFAILFAYWLCLIPLAFFYYRVTLVPQATRYQLELELALCLLVGVLFARLLRHTGKWTGYALVAAVLIVSVRQTTHFRRFGRGLIVPIDIAQTIQYKTCMWLDQNLKGQRTMVSGDTEYICNTVSDNPQLSSGHEPSAPNWMQRVAVYSIYTGTPDGKANAEISILWLKAFATQAITVPGPKSRESYHPVAFPGRFEGVLPVLWRDEDDTIYAVPQRSRSLARIVPASAIVSRAPVHGLDIDPLRPFVGALDDPALPLADLRWDTPSRGIIHASMQQSQVIALAVNYAPGWEASVSGRRVPVKKDPIGLMVISPQCDGPCQVDIRYGVTAEAWLCRFFSAIVTLGMCLLLAPDISARVRKAPRPLPLPR